MRNHLLRIRTLLSGEPELAWSEFKRVIALLTRRFTLRPPQRLAFFWDRVSSRAKLNLRSLPSVVCDLGDRDLMTVIRPEIGDWRNLFHILSIFADTGHFVTAVLPLDFEQWSNTYLSALFRLPNVRIVSHVQCPRPTDTIYVTSAGNRKCCHEKWKRDYVINFNVATPYQPLVRPLILPYGMHPNVYLQNPKRRFNRYRRSERRRVRLLFFAEPGAAAYSQPVCGHSMTRCDVLDVVENDLPIEQKLTCSDPSDFFRLFTRLRKYENKLAYSCRRRPQREWLATVSMADFFLCAPGQLMPLCHNAIESMAVGTIPVISYPDWFTPPLRHLENCVAFDSPQDLLSKLQFVFAMAPERIAEMRGNVIKYYQSSLSPESTMKRLVSREGKVIEVFFPSEADHYLMHLTERSVIYHS